MTFKLDNMKKINFAIILTLTGLLSASWSAAAAETPEQICEKYFAAIKQQGATASVDFIHPDELLRFKQMLLPIFDVSDEQAKSGVLQALYGKNTTSASVKTMPPADFMRGFMKISDAQSKSMNVSFGDLKILGSVKEGDVVHLLTKHSAGTKDYSLTELEILSLKPYQNSWRVLLSGKLEGMAQAIKTQILKARSQK